MENPVISRENSKEIIILEIPYKLPSLNEYVNACRTNQYVGAEILRLKETLKEE